MRSLAVLAFVATAATAQTAALVVDGRDGSHVRLFEHAGPCVEGARFAEWVSPDAKKVIPGCWKLAGPMVMLAFFDGDGGPVPVQAFRKPTSL